MSTTTINGRVETLSDDPDAMLIDVVRDQLGLTGTKLVCGGGVCGACTVLVDGVPVTSCLMPARAVAGKSVTTVEGIGANNLHPVQKAFMAHDALQCGFCTPGFVVEAAAFCDRWRAANASAVPSREEIAAALSGHLCRCGAYDAIYRAVADACAGRFDGENFASPRIEARAKVTGAAKYTVDIKHDGQLEGVILRSQHAHARISALDLAPAQALPGVTVVSLLSEDRVVRYVGEPIAAVAAKDRRSALAALAAIKVTSEKLPAVIGLDAARKEDAPVVFDRSSRKKAGNVSEAAGGPAPWKQNIRGPTSVFANRAKKARNWVNEARQASSPLLFEGTFRTGTQQHTCLEPHAAVARFDGDRLTVHASSQWVVHLRDQLAKRFKLEPSNIRVIADHVGGGFGSKASIGTEAIAAVELARAAKAPVRVAYDRHEELSVAGYRPAAEVKVALLPSAEGGLKALSVIAHADTGAAINSTIAGLARLMYPAEAKELSDFDVISNLPPGAAFRGPGGPPMSFAVEQAVDEAALRLKIDPIALRKRWDPDPNRQRLYDWALGLDTWRDSRRNRPASQTGRYRRGVGVATGYWFYLWQPKVKVEVAVKGGRIVVSTATQDIGTGIRSVLADTLAREFDLEPGEIEVRIGDSVLPEGPGAGGSRVTASLMPPTLQAIEKLKAAILAQATRKPAPGSNAPWRELIARSADIAITETRGEDGKNTAPGVRSPLKDLGLLGIIFGWMMRRNSNIVIGAGVPSSVQVIEVEVDTWLGHVRVLKVHTGIAVGKIAAPQLAHNQACGAVIQGLGYALYEAREIDPRSGDVLTGGMEDYRIPGIADTPEIGVHFDEGGFDHVVGNSVGIGEVATVPTSPAVANAIFDAIGVRLTEIPIRPDRIVAALKGRTAA
ncbi:dehydrogenase [Bradyrhizobium guangdongense]|uniref:molybdopterin-dependent oxidoreductase n=1 Tax=Bradyrhizobium guangdongense TaxID=1325090 RepID=UPI00112D19E5|nr:molybdopterin-dependent oxidoreductase [Bradyrhizobium guangdongense]TPQ32486.1 dehydrogenase [Bradyrhizobium guangdongense]